MNLTRWEPSLLTRWEPFREMEDFFRTFSPFFGRRLRRRYRGEEIEWSPTADIIENDKEYLIKAELPGVKKEDVKITVENGVITLSGERKQEKESKEDNELRVERFYGAFSRSFVLPDDANSEGIRAESKDGVLSIHIPKTESKKPKPIQIEVK